MNILLPDHIEIMPAAVMPGLRDYACGGNAGNFEYLTIAGHLGRFCIENINEDLLWKTCTVIMQ